MNAKPRRHSDARINKQQQNVVEDGGDCKIFIVDPWEAHAHSNVKAYSLYEQPFIFWDVGGGIKLSHEPFNVIHKIFILSGANRFGEESNQRSTLQDCEAVEEGRIIE